MAEEGRKRRKRRRRRQIYGDRKRERERGRRIGGGGRGGHGCCFVTVLVNFPDDKLAMKVSLYQDSALK